MKQIIIAGIFFLVLFNNIEAQQTTKAIYTPNDSLYIESLLNKDIHANTINEYLLFYATELQGIPYAGGTLDINPNEILIINLHELDCTTFVETVLALSITKQRNEKTIKDFAHNLQFIRYRDGIINGYTSRLHYFSDWILNNTKKGIIKEITDEHSAYKIPLHLYFMSENKDKYQALKNNPEAVEKIKADEQNIAVDSVYYIPKETLNKMDLSWIKSGDIIAITTGRPGLDITHVGIAQNINGSIYLIHASLKARKVTTEENPLSIQLSRNKNQTGIRVIRPITKKRDS